MKFTLRTLLIVVAAIGCLLGAFRLGVDYGRRTYPRDISVQAPNGKWFEYKLIGDEAYLKRSDAFNWVTGNEMQQCQIHINRLWTEVEKLQGVRQ